MCDSFTLKHIFPMYCVFMDVNYLTLRNLICQNCIFHGGKLYVVKCKLLFPTSILADNYRYLCNKYNIAHSDWYRDMSFIRNMICTEYTNHQYDICKTVTELCELRDGVAHCGVVNRTDICSLLEVLCTD